MQTASSELRKEKQEIEKPGLMFEIKERRKFRIKEEIRVRREEVVLRDYIEKKRNYLLGKRIMDVTISLFAIVFVFSWLFPILYILIKIDSRGPVFFVQKRVGFLGRSFYCIKFRTMYINPEAHTRQAVDNDPRITRFGRFLRNSNLDETPQFLNVFMGHMSIVGPRPHMHKDCLNFSDKVDSYKFRNLMKPGITGLAQVKGYRGPAMDFDRIFKRYQWDAFYVRNANPWLDFRIVRKTAVQTIGYIITKLFSSKQEEPSSEENSFSFRTRLVE